MGANASTNREGVSSNVSTLPSPAQSPLSADTAADKCPIDHKSREAWLQKAREAGETATPPHPLPASPSIPAGESCDSSQMDQSTPTPRISSPRTKLGLAVDREVSTIPRAFGDTGGGNVRPANHEVESGKDTKSGNWIYPSEQMFFDAMKRKNFSPNATDMSSIVPIHNAVNERAWQEILAWERGRGGDRCGGPKLLSFSGQATALTPKARFNSLMGYSKPFDRHDWVVDRCGERVDYVIDFYAGKDEGKPGKQLNFYLDVRPKLNTWEGCRMRAAKILGL